jgi:hypothetical protein
MCQITLGRFYGQYVAPVIVFSATVLALVHFSVGKATAHVKCQIDHPGISTQTAGFDEPGDCPESRLPALRAQYFDACKRAEPTVREDCKVACTFLDKIDVDTGESTGQFCAADLLGSPTSTSPFDPKVEQREGKDFCVVSCTVSISCKCDP